jgi:ZIP family zinc transporter
LTAFGASFVFLFKTMNRVFLDGMLGFTGGSNGCCKFLELTRTWN